VPDSYDPIEIGKARIISEGNKIAILSLGTRLSEVKKASDILETFGLSTTVVDARFAKPLDKNLIINLSENHEVIITIEEGSSGGFGSSVLNLLANSSKLDVGLKIRTLTLPDRFIAHATPEEMYEEAELVRDKIVEKVLDTMNIKSPDLKIVDPKK
jgi:1-deoxy-D-xylulose-5-phosphate synthase